jgi:hypothetical protein
VVLGSKMRNGFDDVGLQRSFNDVRFEPWLAESAKSLPAIAMLQFVRSTMTHDLLDRGINVQIFIIEQRVTTQTKLNPPLDRCRALVRQNRPAKRFIYI